MHQASIAALRPDTGLGGSMANLPQVQVPVVTLPARNLDVLRAVAVTCVVMDHLLWKILPDDFHQLEMVLGRVGVLLFFVHTSLVLMGSTDGLRKATPRAGDWIPRFYVKRWFRIYPLSLAVVGLIVLAGVAPPETKNLGAIVSNLFLVQNLTQQPAVLSVLWTLPIELQMYMLLPFCYMLACRGARWVIVLLGLAAMAGTIVFTVIRGQELSVTPWALAIFTPCFLAGVLAYSLLRHNPQSRKADGRWWPIVLGVILTLFTVVFHPAWNSPARGWPMCVTLGLMIPLFRDMGDSMFTRAAQVIAKYSYGIYLLHLPVLIIAFVKLPGPRALHWFAFVILITALPALAYHLIEAPGIALGKRWTGGEVAVRVPTAGAEAQAL